MRTVIGIFKNQEDADMAISELNGEGFDTKNMSVVVRDDIVNKGKTRGEAVADNTASGATTGGIIGGIVGLLVGVGAIAIPGIGGLLIGGPLAAALGLTGAAATTVSGATTGVLAGGIVGALTGLGVPAEEAKQYEERIKSGAVLLAVEARDTEAEDRVKTVYENHQADQVRTLT